MQNFIDKHVSRHTGGRSSTSTPPSRPSSAASHGRLLTISKGHTVSVVVTSSALETIAASREAKRSALLRESVQRALQLVNAGQGRDRPHVWHARLAMRNPFLPVLIICPSLSPTHPSWIFVGCPASTLSASVTGSYKSEFAATWFAVQTSYNIPRRRCRSYDPMAPREYARDYVPPNCEGLLHDPIEHGFS